MSNITMCSRMKLLDRIINELTYYRPYAETANAILSLIQAERDKEVCEWTQNEDDECWEGECERVINCAVYADEKPDLKAMPYCPCCGRKIVIPADQEKERGTIKCPHKQDYDCDYDPECNPSTDCLGCGLRPIGD